MGIFSTISMQGPSLYKNTSMEFADDSAKSSLDVLNGEKYDRAKGYLTSAFGPRSAQGGYIPASSGTPITKEQVNFAKDWADKGYPTTPGKGFFGDLMSGVGDIAGVLGPMAAAAAGFHYGPGLLGGSLGGGGGAAGGLDAASQTAYTSMFGPGGTASLPLDAASQTAYNSMFPIGASATTAGATTAGAAGGAPSWMSSIKDLFSGASALNKSSGGLLGNALGAGVNYFTSMNTADKYIDAAKQIQEGAKPLNDPQRQQYQTLLSDLENNPSTFWQTNPVAIAQLDLAKNMFEANSAKMGTGGTQFSDYLKNVTNAASGTFNEQAQLLSGLGGFTFPGQGGAGAQLMGQGVQAGSEAWRGLGNLFGNNIMAPGQSKEMQNPISKSFTQFAQ